MKKSKLTLGPCFFNWSVDHWKNFYYDIATTSLDEVYIGETVCLRRDPFFKDALHDIIEHLENNGKKVILSTMLLILGQPELKRVEELINQYSNYIFEVNDTSVLSLLKDKSFVVGPGFNTYNEATIQFLQSIGANRICLPYELNKESIEQLSKNNLKEVEVMVFGKIPLAISARCYHARLHNKPKIDCEYVCNLDYNGKEVKTLDNEDFLTINGTQTMSYSYNNLIMELKELQEMGVNCFRISPHHLDMKNVVNIFRSVLDDKISGAEGFSKLLKILPKESKFSNGFYYGQSGKSLENKNV